MTGEGPAGLAARLSVLQERGRLPSIVGGVLRGGRLAAVVGVGADPGTAYRIGSITKTFTAALVLQARDEGLLTLDDPLGRWLPGVPHAEVVLADLLGHTGGLPSEPAGAWWERVDGGDREALLATVDAARSVATPGEVFHYSNLGYALLGAVVEEVRGAPWWQVVQDRLIVPLGMGRTTAGPEAPYAPGRSVEHLTGRLVPEPHTSTGAMAPAGQAWSTVEDLASWAGVLAGRRPDVLAPATAAEMARPRPRSGDGYGLGVRRTVVDGRVLVGHTGSMPGFLASLFIDPGTGDGAVALTNATSGLVTEDVPGALLAGPDPEPVAPWWPTTDLPDAAAEVVGWWFWGSTALELRWDRGRLVLRTAWTATDTDVFELRGDRVVGVDGYHAGEELLVRRAADGSVHHLEVATFVLTRTPYDASAPIPGGPARPLG